MESQWYLSPIFDSYTLVVAIVATLTLLSFLIRPAFPNATRKHRRALNFIRLTLILLVAVAMLRPSHIRTETREESSTLIVLLDRSRSMEVTDVSGSESRWAFLRNTLRRSLPELEAAGDRLNWKVYMFDGSLEAATTDGKSPKLPAKPTGDQSDIGAALDEVLRREAGQRLAAVVLVSDGAQQAIRPRVDAQRPARDLARLDTPLYTVVLGKPRDQVQSRDVAVQNLRDEYSVFVKNELVVRATVRVQGYVQTPLPVEMMIVDPNGKRQSVDQQVVQATEDGEQLNIEMTYVPQEPGQYKLTLQIPQQEGEPIVDNNLQTAYVNVLEGGLRVLFLDSNVVWQEQKFLRRSIDESVDIQLDWQWLDVRLRQQWPVNLAQIVGGNNYDVYLLGDVPAAALGSEGCRLLAQQVQSGKGLMMCGGYHSFGPGGYADTALRDVLPIEMLRSESQPFGAEPWPDSHLQRPLAMRPSDEDHFVTRLGGRDDNLSVWRRLPPLDEANKFGRLKPAAVVIAKAETGEPLLVQGNSGNGRVLAFAGDSTYRWYRHGFQAEHKRFWRQAILWLARKDESQRQNVWVQLDQRRVLPGGSVKLTTGATNANGDIIEDAIFETILHAPDGTQQAIRVSPDGESWTGTCEDLALPGDYRLQVKARRGGADIGSAESNFVVVQQDLELLEPAANPQFMAMLSQLTADSGGKTVAPEQMPALFHDIATQPPRTEVTRQTKWQLATTPLDTWLYFLTLIALISSEWFLRKKWGMV